MADNVIKAVFAGGRKVKTAPLWRYDHGIKLQPVGLTLPDLYEMHFSNGKTGEAKTVLADANGAVIPSEYLIPGREVYAWVYLAGDSYGRTKAEIVIPVDPKAQPTDQELTPEQESVLEQAISALNAAEEAIPEQINSALETAKNSGEFDGADGNSIWWASEANAQSGGKFVAFQDNMVGRSGDRPTSDDQLVNDLLVAPAPVTIDGEETTAVCLFRITRKIVTIAVNLEFLCILQGDKGDDGGSIWWSQSRPIDDNRGARFSFSQLSGRASLQPAVGDLIIGQKVAGVLDDAVYLYSVTDVEMSDGGGTAFCDTIVCQLTGPKGADGADGNSIWQATGRPIEENNAYRWNPNKLSGRTGIPPAVGDLVVGNNAFGIEDDAVYLYAVTSIEENRVWCQRVCKLTGDANEIATDEEVDAMLDNIFD